MEVSSWENPLFLWAIFQFCMAMLVITRGYHYIHLTIAGWFFWPQKFWTLIQDPTTWQRQQEPSPDKPKDRWDASNSKVAVYKMYIYIYRTLDPVFLDSPSRTICFFDFGLAPFHLAIQRSTETQALLVESLYRHGYPWLESHIHIYKYTIYNIQYIYIYITYNICICVYIYIHMYVYHNTSYDFLCC